MCKSWRCEMKINRLRYDVVPYAVEQHEKCFEANFEKLKTNKTDDGTSTIVLLVDITMTSQERHGISNHRQLVISF